MSTAVAAQTMTAAVAAQRGQKTTERVRGRPGVERLPALTGLRFVAAALVVVHHWMRHWRTGVVGAGPLHDVLWMGYQAVGLFFVLSGFVLAHSYLSTDGRLRGTRRGFYVARFARLYPLYLVAALAAAAPYVWSLHGLGVLRVSVVGLATLALVQSWAPDTLGGWNPPGWSLSTEAFFYAVFPALGPRLARLRTAHLWALLGAGWLCSVAVPLGYLLWVRAGLSAYTFFPGGLYNSPLARLPEFVIGVALGCLFARERAAGRAPRRPAALLVGAALAALASLVAVAQVPGPLPVTGLLAPVWGLLVYAAAWGRGPLARALAAPALCALGEASYGLYLLHWPLWDWLTRLLGVPAAVPARLDASACALFGAYALLLVTLTLLLHRCVEEPARRWLRRRLTPDGGVRAACRVPARD